MSPALLDEDRLARLAADLGGDVAACRRLADEFASAWGSRFVSVRESAEGRGIDRGIAALLSISTTGRMLGTLELAASADVLRLLVPGGEVDADRLRAFAVLGGRSLEALGAAVRRLPIAA